MLKSNPRVHFKKPRLGFLGVGWIGRHRMEALARSGLCEIAVVADPVAANSEAALKLAPDAACVGSLGELLGHELDGVVIATPSALHAEQAIAALNCGAAVFCQKPLARTAEETQRVVEAARKANRLLGVDLSYRHTSGVQQIRRIVQEGGIGQVFAGDLVFHNAYGPDKAWFYDVKLSGGGCVMDLGIHLVDLAFWVLNSSKVEHVTSRLYAGGLPLPARPEQVEDYAIARVDLQNGTSLQLACSWKLQAGCDALISASFYGTEGGVEFRNVAGSFYEFKAERFYGTRRELLFSGLEDWGGRAALQWLKQLSEGAEFDPEVEDLVQVAATLDRIYRR